MSKFDALTKLDAIDPTPKLCITCKWASSALSGWECGHPSTLSPVDGQPAMLCSYARRTATCGPSGVLHEEGEPMRRPGAVRIVAEAPASPWWKLWR